MTKYLLLIDTDNPTDVQLFTPPDVLVNDRLIPNSAEAHALAPHVAALKARNRPAAAVATKTRAVKAKVAKPKVALGPVDEDGVWVDTKEAARQLGLAESSIFYRLKKGDLIGRKVGGVRQFSQGSLDAFKAAQS